VVAKANTILQQQKLYTTYTKAELCALLLYHQVTDISATKKNSMIAKWEEIMDSKMAAPVCELWSDEYERRLMHLTSQPITMGDTASGRHQEVIKRQVSNVITKMSKEERRELKRKLESMEEYPDSPEVNITVMPNVNTEIPSMAQDEKAAMEQCEEVPTQDLDEVTTDNA
jgi:hypothetical protein